MDKHFTVPELAEIMNVSQNQIRMLIKTGELPAYTIGKDYRITHEGYQAFINSRTIRPKRVNCKVTSERQTIKKTAPMRRLTLADVIGN